MSARGPPRKRQKTSRPFNTTSSANAPSAEVTNNLQSIVTALIPAIIPAVTQSVVTSLSKLGVIRKNATERYQNTADKHSQSQTGPQTTMRLQGTQTIPTPASTNKDSQFCSALIIDTGDGHLTDTQLYSPNVGQNVIALILLVQVKQSAWPAHLIWVKIPK